MQANYKVFDIEKYRKKKLKKEKEKLKLKMLEKSTNNIKHLYFTFFNFSVLQ